MNIPWPVFVILGPAIAFALLGVRKPPFRLEHATGPFVQGALAGTEASLAWWIAGKGSGLTALLLDVLVGILVIAALLQLVSTFAIAMEKKT
jgi:hypothetical protein